MSGQCCLILAKRLGCVSKGLGLRAFSRLWTEGQSNLLDEMMTMMSITWAQLMPIQWQQCSPTLQRCNCAAVVRSVVAKPLLCHGLYVPPAHGEAGADSIISRTSTEQCNNTLNWTDTETGWESEANNFDFLSISLDRQGGTFVGGVVVAVSSVRWPVRLGSVLELKAAHTHERRADKNAKTAWSTSVPSCHLWHQTQIRFSSRTLPFIQSFSIAASGWLAGWLACSVAWHLCTIDFQAKQNCHCKPMAQQPILFATHIQTLGL